MKTIKSENYDKVYAWHKEVEELEYKLSVMEQTLERYKTALNNIYAEDFYYNGDGKYVFGRYGFLADDVLHRNGNGNWPNGVG
jgi:hypothetical protein